MSQSSAQTTTRQIRCPPAICVTLLSLMLATNAFSACSLEKYAELPVIMNDRQPTIEGSINGTPATFLADSGGFYSLLWADRVGRFNLHLNVPPGGFTLQGVGGKEDTRVTTIQGFSLRGLGGGVLHKIQFLVAGQAPTATDGDVGQNILGRADAEYDLGNGVIRLFRPSGCENYSLAYWHGTAPISELPIRRTTDLEPHIIAPARLNGLEISVGFDSGSTNSFVSLKAATRAGFDPAKSNGNVSGKFAPIGAREFEMWLTRFDDLDLGGEEIKHVRMMVSDAVMPGDFDLILGVDFFLSHRIYIAQSQHKIYFTYNGGQIFDLPVAPSAPAATESAAVAVDESTTGSPEDGAQYMRRGAASAARGDFPRAIADFDAAIRLNSDDADSYYRRGLAKWQIHQLPAAKEDFDQALKLQPHNVQWLRMRGVLRLATHDDEAAAADFDAWARLIPEAGNPDLEIADIYADNDRFEAAIHRLNGWIEIHARDPNLAITLNDRCWFRAQWGKELDKALADCNAALKLEPRAMETLDSRALVYLRLGDYDKSITDYEAALRRKPKEVWSLYGLGLAQLHKGRQVEADRNMQKALAIDSATAERFQRIGLVP